VLTEAHHHLSHLEQLALARSTAVEDTVFLSIDVEKNERGPEILEVGLAFLTASNSWFFPEITCKHLILEDHDHIRNHRAGYDNKDNFDFGVSEKVNQHTLPSKVHGIVEELRSSGGPVILIGHTVHNDISWLSNAGVTLDAPVCDIGKAFQAQQESVQQIGLRNMMDALGIEHRNLHNGGNDAFYTMKVFLEMVEMVDVRQGKDQGNELSLL
jgi:DNA polymerase III epsilon subunit-like protein